MGGCIAVTKIGARAHNSQSFVFLVGIYLSLMKNFRNTFLRNYESQKAETWYKHGQWVDVSRLPK